MEYIDLLVYLGLALDWPQKPEVGFVGLKLAPEAQYELKRFRVHYYYIASPSTTPAITSSPLLNLNPHPSKLC
jgi:hypothetical protein